MPSSVEDSILNLKRFFDCWSPTYRACMQKYYLNFSLILLYMDIHCSSKVILLSYGVIIETKKE